MNYTKEQVRKLMEGIYAGTVTELDLPEDLYFAIAEALKEKLYEGFGGALVDFEGAPLDLLTELRENVYMFSGAKTFQQVRELTEAVAGENGKRPFKEFFERAKEIDDQYNKNWARTEQDTAFASGQQGQKWTQIEADADILPYLEFDAVMDANTTDECQHMNGVCAPINDPIWRTCYPPNHWNCRSTVTQTDDKSKLSSKKELRSAKEATEADMQDVFKMNVGQDGIVFSDKHPYFQVGEKYKDFGKENFGLPIPKDDD